MEGLDSMARRYGQRPSAFLRITDEYKALSIDLFAHNWGVQRDAFELKKLEKKRRGR